MELNVWLNHNNNMNNEYNLKLELKTTNITEVWKNFQSSLGLIANNLGKCLSIENCRNV